MAVRRQQHDRRGQEPDDGRDEQGAEPDDEGVDGRLDGDVGAGRAEVTARVSARSMVC